MTLVLVALGAQLVASLAFLLCVFAVSRAVRVPIERLQLGLGPALVRRIGSVELALGAVPLGAWVRFARAEDAEDPELDVMHEAPAPDALDRASGLARVAIALAGPLGMAIVALIGLGPAEGALEIAQAFAQLPLGAVAPLSLGRAMIAAAAARPVLAMGALIAAKLAAYNLFPVPGTSIWRLLEGVVPALRRARWLGLVPAALGVSWLIALVAWAVSGE